MIQRINTKPKLVKLFENDDGQVVRLPPEFRFDADEVYVTRDESTGNVTLSTQPNRNSWKEFIEFRDSLDIPQEDLDDYMAERPMNVPNQRPGVFENDD